MGDALTSEVTTEIEVRIYLSLLPDLDIYSGMAIFEVERTRALNRLLDKLILRSGNGFRGEADVEKIHVDRGVPFEHEINGFLQRSLASYTQLRQQDRSLLQNNLGLPLDWTLRLAAAGLSEDLYYYRDKTGAYCNSQRSLLRIDRNLTPQGEWVVNVPVGDRVLPTKVQIGVRYPMVRVPGS